MIQLRSTRNRFTTRYEEKMKDKRLSSGENIGAVSGSFPAYTEQMTKKREEQRLWGLPSTWRLRIETNTALTIDLFDNPSASSTAEATLLRQLLEPLSYNNVAAIQLLRGWGIQLDLSYLHVVLSSDWSQSPLVLTINRISPTLTSVRSTHVKHHLLTAYTQIEWGGT